MPDLSIEEEASTNEFFGKRKAEDVRKVPEAEMLGLYASSVFQSGLRNLQNLQGPKMRDRSKLQKRTLSLEPASNFEVRRTRELQMFSLRQNRIGDMHRVRQSSVERRKQRRDEKKRQSNVSIV